MSHPHLPNPLLRATLCGVDIVIAWTLKTPRLLPAVYAIIIGTLWLYGFDWKKASKVRYMAGNFPTSQVHRKYNKSSVEHTGKALGKC